MLDDEFIKVSYLAEQTGFKNQIHRLDILLKDYLSPCSMKYK